MPVNFDAIDEIIDCGSGGSISNLTSMSLSWWQYVRSNGEGNLGRVFEKRSATAQVKVIFHTSVIAQSLNWEHATDGTTLDVDMAAGTLTFNVWQHIIMTWDGSLIATNVHFYLNGTETSYLTQQNGTGTLALDDTGSWYIGNRPVGDRTSDAIYSEFAVWNVVLSNSEISQLSQSKVKGIPYQIRPSNLVAYWPLDDFSDNQVASGTGSVRDRSSNANHGTPSNSPNCRAEQVLSYP